MPFLLFIIVWVCTSISDRLLSTRSNYFAGERMDRVEVFVQLNAVPEKVVNRITVQPWRDHSHDEVLADFVDVIPILVRFV